MKYLMILVCAVTLSGCAVTLPFSLTATGASYAITGKSISDNLYSLATDQDCAIHRALIQEQVCAPDNDAISAEGGQQALAFVASNKQGVTSAVANR